jgi:crotonobetainyl-CoA:carnitine CoA-transferase CaiB-like acyl-CoA transferase
VLPPSGAIHPALIMCSISLAGQTGPLSRKPGFDYMGAAYAGMTALIGEADRGPAQFATAIGDHATGVTAAMSIGFASFTASAPAKGNTSTARSSIPTSTCTK